MPPSIIGNVLGGEIPLLLLNLRGDEGITAGEWTDGGGTNIGG